MVAIIREANKTGTILRMRCIIFPSVLQRYTNFIILILKNVKVLLINGMEAGKRGSGEAGKQGGGEAGKRGGMESGIHSSGFWLLASCF